MSSKLKLSVNSIDSMSIQHICILVGTIHDIPWPKTCLQFVTTSVICSTFGETSYDTNETAAVSSSNYCTIKRGRAQRMVTWAGGQPCHISKLRAKVREQEFQTYFP